jgi:hypothetical protein
MTPRLPRARALWPVLLLVGGALTACLPTPPTPTPVSPATSAPAANPALPPTSTPVVAPAGATAPPTPEGPYPGPYPGPDRPVTPRPAPTDQPYPLPGG